MVSYGLVSKLELNNKTFYDSKDLSVFLNLEGRNLENTIKKLIDENVIMQLERDKYYVASKTPSEMQIAYFLYNPSYISFETALNYYGVLSQFPTTITSVTTKKTKNKTVEGREYTYSHINKSYFTGYEKKDGFLIATPEKALVDQMYFSLKSLKSLENIDEYDMSNINKDKAIEYAKQIQSISRAKIIEMLDKQL